MQRVTMTEVYEEIGRWAPWDTAEEWDNVGVLVQGPDEVVTGICCMLDITLEAVAWAAEKGCNLVLSHHPVIFRPMKKLSRESVPAVLVRNGVTALCAHTNLDKARGGVCETLAQQLGLRNIRPGEDFLYFGELEQPMPLAQWAAHVRDSLGTSVAWTGEERTVRTVAVVSGAGGDFWPQAQAAGADCLVTGEMSHHEALDAQQAGMAAVAATHYGTEKWIVPVMAARLHKLFPELPVYEWDRPEQGESHDPFQHETN